METTAEVFGRGPNIIEAMLGCAEEAVDIETNKENNNDPQ